MNQLDVRVVTLPAMRMVSAYGFGTEPESIAGKKMADFMKSKGLLEGYGSLYAHYGFNNPSPSSGSPNYGYEIWVQVPEDIQPEGDLREVMFEGGRYAVTRFVNLFKIGEVWSQLASWREDSPYDYGTHQWLEHLLNPLEPDMEKYEFELFLPIK